MDEDTLSKLERLGKLREQGVITPEEFDQQKAAVLNNTHPQPQAPRPAIQTTPQPAPAIQYIDPPKTSVWKWIGIGFVGLLVISFIGQMGRNQQSLSETSASTESTMITDSLQASSVETPTETKPAEKWFYFDNSDKMGSKYYIATIDANEQLQFDFPYNGGSTASFSIRKKGASTDVYLKVSKGQFITHSSDGGTARIRFDDGKPITYSTSGAADYSSDIIFFDNEKAIIAKLKKAKKIVIEAPFYNEGNQQMEFDVAGFKWNH
ncbi:SHOCT domain-containing protein [Spirosoma sp. KNUC1025]|uniref:SHOCT domain-containing protein n=1 Tax=Spirosoma sp. KNUC1025 TaxID=2894082 RepID=UPI00386A5B3B|nr:SHOCT domain-containing protein [Spirosoma sp. KNUC1025]